jgi:hypothetical protein
VTTLELEEPALEPVALGLEERRLLGAASLAPDAVGDRISIGRPVCKALDLDTVDADARDFLGSRPSSSFWLLALTCSFLAANDEPIETAWLRIQLKPEAPAGAETPIAWSMEPLALTDLVQISRSAKLDATLKLKSEVVPIEVGPAVARETSQQYERRVPFVEAHQEGTPQPSWIFTRTAVTEVRGVHHLRTVVELPAGATGQAEVSAGATLKLKALGLIPYRAQLENLPEHQSVPLGP